MLFKVEARYLGGWDDAGWTEDSGGESKPLRFVSPLDAQMAIDEFFHRIRLAVMEGQMDQDENAAHYRIVKTKD